MITYNVSEAKIHFSTLVDQGIAGETVCIIMRNVPVAQITPLPVATPQKHHMRVGWAKVTVIEIHGDLTEPVLPC